MSDPLNDAPLSDDVFQNRIAAALRELEHPETDADLAAALDAIESEPLAEVTVQRILRQVRSSIAADRPVNGQTTVHRGSGNSATAVRAEVRSRKSSSHIPIVIACSTLVVVIGLMFQQLSAIKPDRSVTAIDVNHPRVTHVLLSANGRSPRELTGLGVAAGVQRVQTGDTIRTGPREKRRITLPDGSVLSMNESSQVTVVGPRRLKLVAGEVFVEVIPANFAPAGQADRFVVETPQRSVTALGTKFVVKAEGQATNVIVTQGKVQVSGVDQIIPAGQELIADLNDSHSAQIQPARRSAFVVEWVKDLMAAAGAALVPFSEHSGGSVTVVDPEGQAMKLSLRKFHVDVHIEDGFARTTIDQTYFNHTWQQLEGTFRFPLPADASLSRLAMYVNGTLMEGGMVERDHGRNVFEQIRHTRRDPALLEWVDGSTFQMRVFPLEARQEKRILLSYTQRLQSDYGKTVYRFPSGHNLEGVKEWSTHLVAKNAAGSKWHSPSHLLNGRDDQGDLILDGREEFAALDRDLVVELGDAAPTTPSVAGTKWSVYEQEGFQYVMLRQRPDLKVTSVRTPRQWVFLMENSADRHEVLAETQRLIAKTLLENVEHSDTFSIIRTGTRPDLFRPQPSDCSLDNIAAALRFLNEVAPIGALDLQQGLQAVSQQVSRDRDNWLVHLGTGIPVLGERDETTLRRLLPTKTRYVGVAVGKRWSRSFMETAASLTGGHVTQINPDEAVAWRAFDLLSTLNAPRLTEIAIQSSEAGGDPAASSGQFLLLSTSLAHGQELAAVARFATGKPLPRELTMTGKLDGRPYSLTIPLPCTADATSVLDSRAATVTSRSGHLPRTWARCEIDRLVALGAAEHKTRIVELSKAMYVMSPFTSLLVLETEAMYAQFNVDRGRKDHWALYVTPAQIPVVAESAQIQATPLAAAQERLKAAQSRVKTAQSNLDRSLAEKRPAADVQRLERLNRAEQAELKLLEAELHRIEQAQKAADDPVRKAWDSVILRRSAYGPRHVQVAGNFWGFNRLHEFEGEGVNAGAGLSTPRYWYRNRLSDLQGLSNGSVELRFAMPNALSLGRQLTAWEEGESAIQGDGFIPLFGTTPFRGMSRDFDDVSDLVLLQRQDGRLPGLQTSDLGVTFVRGNESDVEQVMAEIRRHEMFGDVATRRLYFDLGGTLLGNGSLNVNMNGADQAIIGLSGTFDGRTDRFFRPTLSTNGIDVSGFDGVEDGQLLSSRNHFMDVDFNTNGVVDWDKYRVPPAAMMGRPGPMVAGPGPGVLPMFFTSTFGYSPMQSWGAYPNSAVVSYPKQYVPAAGFLPLGWRVATTTWGDGEWVVDSGMPGAPVSGVNMTAWGMPITGTPIGLPGPPHIPLGGPAYAPMNVVRDLPSCAPGLQTWSADRLAIVAQSIEVKPKTGDVDAEARQLINKARTLGWETLKFVVTDQQHPGNSPISLIADGSGRFVLRREIGEGLQETVIHDGGVLWHLYPEIGLGAKRSLSRFHQPAIQSLIPWYVPSVDDLSVEADIKVVAERTIRITRIKGDAEVPAKHSFAIEVVFAESGRLAETRVIDTTANQVLARQVITSDGVVQRFNGTGKLLAEARYERQPAEAPNLVPETTELVILPMPYRSSTGLPVTVPVDLQTNAPDYTKLSDDDALMLVATYFAESRPNELMSLLQSRYAGRNDHRMGFVVLMVSVQPQNTLVTNVTKQHPDSTLAQYLQQFASIATGQSTAFSEPAANARPFLKQISTAYNHYRQWLVDPATLKAKSMADLERQLTETLAVARTRRTLAVADQLVTTVYSQLNSAEMMNPAFARQLNAAATDIAITHAQPAFHRTERIEWLLSAGDDASVAQAKELLRSQLADANAIGALPHLNARTRAAFVKQFKTPEGQSCEAWAGLIREAAGKLQGDNLNLRRVQLARQCLGLKEAKLADEIMEPVLKDNELVTIPNQAVLEYAKEAAKWDLAEACIQRVLADAKLRLDPRQWRDAANIAHNLRNYSEWIQRLDHASELEFAALPKTVNLEEFRNSYRLLFDQLAQRADQLADAATDDRSAFARVVQRAAGRWRDTDVDDTDACHRTAKILTKLGFADAAWNYWTSPLAETPDQSPVWVTFAAAMNEERRFNVADRAWSTAFDCESTNPELLLKHAQFLRTIGQQQRAHDLLTRITTSPWQSRFDPIKTQAQSMLTEGPLPQLKQ